MKETISGERRFRNSIRDWVARVVIFAIFMFFAAGKFSTNPNAPWVVLFRQVGFGQWFRYFTGVVEIVGAFLVLIPQTVPVGLIMLMSTVSGATLVVTVLLHRPADAFIPFALLTGMAAFWMHRRRV